MMHPMKGRPRRSSQTMPNFHWCAPESNLCYPIIGSLEDAGRDWICEPELTTTWVHLKHPFKVVTFLLQISTTKICRHRLFGFQTSATNRKSYVALCKPKSFTLRARISRLANSPEWTYPNTLEHIRLTKTDVNWCNSDSSFSVNCLVQRVCQSPHINRCLSARPATERQKLTGCRSQWVTHSGTSNATTGSVLHPQWECSTGTLFSLFRHRSTVSVWRFSNRLSNRRLSNRRLSNRRLSTRGLLIDRLSVYQGKLDLQTDSSDFLAVKGSWCPPLLLYVDVNIVHR